MEDTVERANPYESYSTTDGCLPDHPPKPVWRTALAGVIWSVVSTFPLAALMALVFRFPIPFGTIASGPSAVVPAMFAVVFYGVLMGGLVVVGIGGGIAGALACLITTDAAQRRWIQRMLSVAVTFFLLFLLATLDWYIGPW